MYQKLTPNFSLSVVLEVLPSRTWVTAAEVAKALNIKVPEVGVGLVLGSLGLPRTCVRVGKRVQRVWLIRGEPQDFEPADVRAELIAHGFPAPQPLERGQGRGKVVSLTKLAHESPNPSPR